MKSKIILTTGPKLCEVSHFSKLLDKNITDFRIHLGKRNRDNINIIKNIKTACKNMNARSRIYLDIPSNRSRIEYVWPMKERFIILNKGDYFKVVDHADKIKNDGYVYVVIKNPKNFNLYVSIWDKLYIKDGSYQAEVTEKTESYLKLHCITDIKLSLSISCIWPDSELHYQILDEDSIQFIKKCKDLSLYPDCIILSFVKDSKEIKEAKIQIKKLFGEKNFLWITKIETKEAIDNLDRIILECDQLMIGRGDLAPQIGFENMPRVQLMISKKAKENNVPYIVATQFLEELAQKNRIYSCELNDIFNAICQGADMIMLAGEGAASANSSKCIELLEKCTKKFRKGGYIEMIKNIKKTKIMATAGPTLQSVDDFAMAIDIGIVEYRIHMGLRKRNFYEYIENLMKASKIKNREVDILLDLPSSRPRMGSINEFQPGIGEIYWFVDSSISSEEKQIPLPSLSSYIDKVKIGHRLSFRDGNIVFRVIQSNGKDALLAECIQTNLTLKEMCSVNFPDSNVVYAPYEKIDIINLEKIHSIGLIPSWVAISFAVSVEQIIQIKSLLEQIWGKNRIKIMCKVENLEGIEKIDELIDNADGIMIARGDLLANIDPTMLPLLQLEIVNKCVMAGKKAVVATEFFERFAESGIVNRSELSDVALACREGSDSIMLARETGNSKYVFECLQLIQKIIYNEWCVLGDTKDEKK